MRAWRREGDGREDADEEGGDGDVDVASASVLEDPSSRFRSCCCRPSISPSCPTLFALLLRRLLTCSPTSIPLLAMPHPTCTARLPHTITLSVHPTLADSAAPGRYQTLPNSRYPFAASVLPSTASLSAWPLSSLTPVWRAEATGEARCTTRKVEKASAERWEVVRIAGRRWTGLRKRERGDADSLCGDIERVERRLLGRVGGDSDDGEDESAIVEG